MSDNQEAMVLQNSRDKVLSKLREKQQENLTEKQQEGIRIAKKRFSKFFFKLAYDFYGYSVGQVKEEFGTDKSHLLEFEKLIAKKATPWSVAQCVFTAIPVVAWWPRWITR